MPTYQLKINEPFERQREILDYLFEPSNEIKLADLVCGRAFGKSVFGVFVAFKAMCRGPNESILFLEPDWHRIRDTFLKKWEEIIPRNLYTHNKSERLIRLINGARLVYAARNVTGNTQSASDSQLGQDTTVVIDDEAALKCSWEFYLNTMGTIRQPSESRFYLTLTTPRVGVYQRLVEQPGHVLFTGTTYDNPYNPKGFADQLVTSFGGKDSERAQREIFGKFISLSGRIWTMVNLRDKWPNGNIDDAVFNRGDPYVLAGDLGVYASWFVIQKFHGRECIVAEYHPDGGGTSEQINFLLRKYGQPSKIITGSDLNASSVAVSTSSAIEIRKALRDRGMYQILVTGPSGGFTDKSIQYGALSSLFESRALTISKNVLSDSSAVRDGNRNRGIQYLIDCDEWPKPGSPTLFEKDAKEGTHWCQDTRDALLYYAICEHPTRI